MRAWLQGTIALVVAGSCAAGVRSCVAEPRTINSGSMEPTLQIGDRVLIDKLSYRFRAPRPGEIVLFDPPARSSAQATPMVKRVVGLPGQRVEVRGGQVWVDGAATVETWLAEPPAYTWGPDEVPPGQLFVLGDNRNASADSHVWGYVPVSTLRGRVLLRIWPVSRGARAVEP